MASVRDTSGLSPSPATPPAAQACPGPSQPGIARDGSGGAQSADSIVSPSVDSEVMRDTRVKDGWSAHDEELLLRAVRKGDLSSFEIWRVVATGQERVAMPESSLLPALRRLAMDGLIVGYRTEETQPVRRRYRITGKGQETAARVREPVSDWWWEKPKPDASSGSMAAANVSETDGSAFTEVKEYGRSVASVLRVTPGLEETIRREVEEHLLDSAAAASPRHVSRAEAASRAIESLGDPRVLGLNIARPVHSPRRQTSALVHAALSVPFAAALGSIVTALLISLLVWTTHMILGTVALAAGIHVIDYWGGEWQTLFATLVLAAGATVGAARAVAEFQVRSMCSRSPALGALVATLVVLMLAVALFAPLADSSPSSLALLLLPLSPITGAALSQRRRVEPDFDTLVLMEWNAWTDWGRWVRQPRLFAAAGLFGVASRRTLTAFALVTVLFALLPGATVAVQARIDLPDSPAVPTKIDPGADIYLENGQASVYIHDEGWYSPELQVWAASIDGYSADVDLGAGPLTQVGPLPADWSFDEGMPMATVLDPRQSWYWLVCTAVGPDGHRYTIAQEILSVAPVNLRLLVEILARP